MKRIHQTHRNLDSILSKYPVKAMFLLVAITLTSLNLFAQPITLSVNMEHTFLGQGDQVVIRGSIPALGIWEAAGELRLRKQGNEGLYTGRLNRNELPEGQILYKYVIIRSDGTEQWEERGNRILDKENTEVVWFDDRTIPGIQQTVVQVTFQLDLTEHSMNGLPSEGVALMGAHAPLSFELETGKTELTETRDGIWETTVAFPFGTPHDVPFKFAWLHDGQWMWEWRAGHTNHVFLIDDSRTQQKVSLRYDPLAPGVLPVEGTSGSVDDYEKVLARLPEQRRAQSRYMYEKAMVELVAGQIEIAKSTYATYKQGHPGGEEVDDFHYRMAHHIQKTQGIQAGQAYIDRQLATEPIAERKAYFTYLKGELALNAGDRATARRLFNQVRKEGVWEESTNYAEQGLVHSYLTESNPDSLLKGVSLLEQQAAIAPQAQHRKYLTRLAHAYRQAELPEKRQAMLSELATTGNPRQQAKGKIDMASELLSQGQASEALGLLDITEIDAQIPKGMLVRLTRLKLEAYHELDMHAELATLFEDYTQTWPNDAYSKRLEKLNEQARNKLGEGWKVQPSLEPAFETMESDSTNH